MFIVRGIFEDPAFDVIAKVYLSHKEQAVNSPQIVVFDFDNHYMQNHQLYDKDDNPEYGYIFPRQHLADFLNNLNKRLLDSDKTGVSIPPPKALLIDFDLSFPTNKAGDNALLLALKKSKVEKIVLVKTAKHHFIEESDDPDIQQLIQQGKILFTSAYIHADKDGIVRRYQPTKEIPTVDEKQLYPNAAHALWKIIQNKAIDPQQIKKDFPDYVEFLTDQDQKKSHIRSLPNVNGNMIWLKTYRDNKGNAIEQAKKDKTACLKYSSNWNQLKKISLNCNLFELDETLFKQSIILLGGTYQPNKIFHAGEGDNHNVLDFMGKSSFGGVDIYANTLMTLLHLDQEKPMQQLKPWYSFVLVFISFFLIDYWVSLFFQSLKFAHEEIELIVSLILNTALLLSLSILLLLSKYHLWFNWIAPLILIELLEILFFIKRHLPKLFDKFRIKL